MGGNPDTSFFCFAEGARKSGGMKKAGLSLLVCAVSLLRAQSPGLQQQLQSRVHAAEAERDAVQIRLLEMEARTRPLVEQLTREQIRLNEDLDSTRKRLLHLESAGGVTDSALRRAEAELLEKTSRVQALETELQRDRQAFEEILAGEQARAGGLEAQRNALEARMNATATQLDSLRAEEAQLRQERGDIANLNRQLEEDVRQARRGESLANAQLTALISRMNLMQNQLEEAYKDRSQALLEADRLNARVQELQKDLEAARAGSTPNQDVARIQQALELVQAENEYLKGALEQLQSMPDLREPLARAERDRDLLDAKLKTLETRLSETQASLQREQSRRRETEADNRGLQERLNQAEKGRQDLHAQLEALRQQQEEQRKLQTEERTALQEQIRGYREEAERAGLRMGELIEVEQATEKFLQERENLLQQLLSKTGEVDSLMDEMALERQRSTREIADLREMLGASMQDMQVAQRRVQDLERGGARLAEVEAEKARFAEAAGRARQDLRVLANHIHSLRSEMARREEREKFYEAERRQLLERIRQLEGLPANP